METFRPKPLQWMTNGFWVIWWRFGWFRFKNQSRNIDFVYISEVQGSETVAGKRWSVSEVLYPFQVSLHGGLKVNHAPSTSSSMVFSERIASSEQTSKVGHCRRSASRGPTAQTTGTHRTLVEHGDRQHWTSQRRLIHALPLHQGRVEGSEAIEIGSTLGNEQINHHSTPSVGITRLVNRTKYESVQQCLKLGSYSLKLDPLPSDTLPLPTNWKLNLGLQSTVSP